MIEDCFKPFETREKLVQTLDTLVTRAKTCDFYSQVYAQYLSRKTSDQTDPSFRRFQAAVDKALPEFYAAVFVFSLKATRYFDPSTSGMCVIMVLQ